MLLDKKVSIITGTNRGIGEEILKTFLENGSHVIACARKTSISFEDLIDNCRSKYNRKIIPVFFDLNKIDEINMAIKTIRSSELVPDILVNNAGIATGALFQMTSEKQLVQEMKVNFISQVVFTQGIVKSMSRKKNGSIINISSVSGIIGSPGTLSYGSSKAALNFATKTLANEIGRYNIRVNSVAPGPIVTDMLDNMDEAAKKKLINSSALKKLGKPKDVANLALFLASDLSCFITGQTIRVDGGII